MKSINLTLVFFLFVISNLIAGTPVKEYIDNPSYSKVNYEEIYLKTEDNYVLKSWVCLPEKAVDKHIVLVLAYGDSGNMSYWLRQVLEVVKSGYTVVMFDYRGYGESQQFVVEESQLYYDEFVTDLKTAVDYAKLRFGYKTGIWALSSGSIISTLCAQKVDVDFMVAEGFMADPQDVKAKLLQYAEKTVSLPPSAKEYELALSKLSVPILLFGGDRDGLTTLDEAYRISFLNKKNKLVIFKGGHLQAFQALTGDSHGQRYIEALNDFCSTSLNE